MKNLTKPQARFSELIVNELPGELLIYDLSSHNTYCLNRSSLTIWNLCDGKNTVADLAVKAEKILDTKINEEIISAALEDFEKFDLLQNPTGCLGSAEKISRRELTRRFGIAAAVALPTIMMISVPTAVHSASLKPIGADCILSSECMTGCCDPVAAVCADEAVCGVL